MVIVRCLCVGIQLKACELDSMSEWTGSPLPSLSYFLQLLGSCLSEQGSQLSLVFLSVVAVGDASGISRIMSFL